LHVILWKLSFCSVLDVSGPGPGIKERTARLVAQDSGPTITRTRKRRTVFEVGSARSLAKSDRNWLPCAGVVNHAGASVVVQYKREVKVEGESEASWSELKRVDSEMGDEVTRVMVAVNESSIKGYPHPSISSRGAFEWTINKIVRNNVSAFNLFFLHVQVPDEDGSLSHPLYFLIVLCWLCEDCYVSGGSI